jgi:asparagine synthase (glutamine-hydrolysing)
MGSGRGKIVLRDVLERYLPASLSERPKMGFAVPLGEWLRTGLREWAADLLDPRRLRLEGYLDEPTVTRLWREHLNGTHDRKDLLWGPLMFQAWLGQRR